MNIINIHVFLNGKIIQIHCASKCFWLFNKLRARTEKVSKNIKHDTQIHPKIDDKSMHKLFSKKVMQQV